MATRGAIGTVGQGEGKFTATYHHWDSMPTSLGKFLWSLLRGHFGNDLGRMLKVLTVDHCAWSTIYQKDFTLQPGYSNDDKRPQPVCFCHGARKEKVGPITHTNIEDSGLEWLYLFDQERNRLIVRDVRHGDEFLIELEGSEPNWTHIECGENFERCAHYAWAHELTPRTCNLSTQEWLGRKPLEFHDAIGFVIGGKKFKATGSGGNSDYFNRTTGQRWPRNAWIASVQARNGQRYDKPVAVIAKDGTYTPFPGVAWIMPATSVAPESIVGGGQ
jgi:hypothetical protein